MHMLCIANHLLRSTKAAQTSCFPISFFRLPTAYSRNHMTPDSVLTLGVLTMAMALELDTTQILSLVLSLVSSPRPFQHGIA